MKKVILIALAASTAIATPALAQSVTTGTINITGSVAGKCSVVPSNSGNTFGGPVSMGELALADGTLKASTTLEGTFGTAGGGALSAKVVCTSPDATVTVDADPLVSAVAVTAGSGYANTVNFTADAKFTKTGGVIVPVSNASTAAAATSATLGGRLAATSTNIVISTSNWKTPGVGDILVADNNYTGKITVTVSPL